MRLSSEAIERSVNAREDRDTLSRRATAVRHARRRLHALPAGRVREPRARSTRRPRRSRRASRRRSHAADGHGLGHRPSGGQRVRRLRPSGRRCVRAGALRTSRRRAGELPAWSRCAPRHRARRRPGRRGLLLDHGLRRRHDPSPSRRARRQLPRVGGRPRGHGTGAPADPDRRSRRRRARCGDAGSLPPSSSAPGRGPARASSSP